MSRKQPPPLTPTDSKYLGEDVNGRHALRWRSQSRDTVTHVSEGRVGGPHTCDCEWFMVMRKQGVRSPSCKHTRGHDDAVAHHLGEPPPADPGGAVGGPPELAGPIASADAARDAKSLDTLVADGGSRWLVSRWGARWGEAQPPASTRVTLTCASCAGTYRFDGEDQARRFVELALPCDQCGAVAGPTPPAPGAARRPVAGCLEDLHGR